MMISYLKLYLCKPKKRFLCSTHKWVGDSLLLYTDGWAQTAGCLEGPAFTKAFPYTEPL